MYSPVVATLPWQTNTNDIHKQYPMQTIYNYQLHFHSTLTVYFVFFYRFPISLLQMTGDDVTQV